MVSQYPAKVSIGQLMSAFESRCLRQICPSGGKVDTLRLERSAERCARAIRVLGTKFN